MKTKIVYVLVSSKRDFFWEQCLISIMSVRYHMPNVNTILVCDTETKNSFYDGIRNEITQYFSEIIAIPFKKNVENVKRSRILKVSLRDIIKGDFLYIDCDTLITQPLYDIDNLYCSIAAVLDGHCSFKNHPMRDFFLSQNKHLNYALDTVVNYFNGGVMYVKDTEEARLFYKCWRKNYLISCKKGVFLDEPALSMTNVEIKNIIQEIDGIWNCQIRFGALYLASNKILHFCSKKNMPVSYLAKKSYLKKIKEHGVNTLGLLEYIANWKSSIPESLVTCMSNDASFVVSPFYELKRREYICQNIIGSIYTPKLNLKEKMKYLRNKIIGSINPKYLSKLLYHETFCANLHNVSDNDFNKMLHMLTFYSDISEWTILADKLSVRDFVKLRGLDCILPIVYEIWDNANSINIENLPTQYVLKCNHDNGSVIVVSDNYSIDKNFILKYYSKKLSKRFGIATAEPHYLNIPRKVFAEEYLENDKYYSDSLVSYKFFSFYGKADYCQVVYDSKDHKYQKTIIYSTNNWEKQDGYIIRNEGNIDIPCPQTLKIMKEIVNTLGSELPFCRIDLYEIGNRVIFSEMTFMPSAGRIKNFSTDFLNILGQKLNKTKHLWIR